MKYKDEELVETMGEVKSAYNTLWKLSESLVKKYTEKVDDLVKSLKLSDIELMTNGKIRQALFDLSIAAYDLGELKDKSCWTSDLSEIIKDEAYAIHYNTADGPVAQRENSAVISISKENAVSSLYKMIAATLKTKLDEVHRLVDALKNILISRASDQKLVKIDSSTGEYI